MIADYLDLKPISINECFQGRRFMTKDYKEWREDGLRILPRQDTLDSHKLEVILTFYLKHPTKRDVDNMVKPMLDLLVQRGYITDDRYIFNLLVFKSKAEREGVDFQIREL